MDEMSQIQSQLEALIRQRDLMIDEIVGIQNQIIKRRGCKDARLLVRVMRNRGLISRWNRLNEQIEVLQKKVNEPFYQKSNLF